VFEHSPRRLVCLMSLGNRVILISLKIDQQTVWKKAKDDEHPDAERVNLILVGGY